MFYIYNTAILYTSNIQNHSSEKEIEKSCHKLGGVISGEQIFKCYLGLIICNNCPVL